MTTQTALDILRVFPDSCTLSPKGELTVAGIGVNELAKEFGTPLFVYDEATLQSRARRYVAAFKESGFKTRVIYATKAFSAVAVCALLAREGLGMDVSTGGELYTALKAGVDPATLYFHGNNKSEREIEEGLAAGVGFFVLDSFNEIERLERLAGGKGVRQKALLRLTPGIKPSTHSFIQTGQIDSKFGFGLAGDTALEGLAAAQRAPHIDLVGLHAHIGSQIFGTDSFEATVEVLARFLVAARERHGFTATVLNLGGGLGIPYLREQEASPIEQLAQRLGAAVKDAFGAHNLPLPQELCVEPGRSIAGPAAFTLYRVGTVKHIPGVRTYVAVDGGMSDNLRPMLYGSRYEAILANRADEEPSTAVRLAGKHCESGDILLEEVLLPEPRVGDLIAMAATGAYGYAMASNYNAQPRPGVVLLTGEGPRVIIARESYDDLLQGQYTLEGTPAGSGS